MFTVLTADEAGKKKKVSEPREAQKIVKVNVLYFASIKDKLGRESEEFELEDGATIKSLVNQIKTGNASISEFIESRAFLFAINQEIVNLDAVLQQNDEIAILPPLSGG